MRNTRFYWLALLGTGLVLGGCSEPAHNSENQQAEAPAGAATGDAIDPAELDALRSRLAGLQGQAQRIRDANDIKRLQRSYGYYMEEALWDEVADLFADDATLEFGRDGVYRGKARIREYLYALNDGKQGLQQGQLNEQLQLMPVVTLGEDGRTAKARWRSIMMTGTLGEQALWGEGPYENEYVKEDGVWKFSRLHWFQTILVPYKGGWAKSEDVNHGIWVSDRLPADEPPTTSYGYWPETFLPPFSFENPVGRYVPPDSATSSSEGGQ